MKNVTDFRETVETGVDPRPPLAFHRITGRLVVSYQVPASVDDPLDTNRFQWKSTFSIREKLRKIPLMLDEGVESRL